MPILKDNPKMSPEANATVHAIAERIVRAIEDETDDGAVALALVRVYTVHLFRSLPEAKWSRAIDQFADLVALELKDLKDSIGKLNGKVPTI
jgi:hypothetical protein